MPSDAATDSPAPLVSVLMVTYNGSQYVQACFESLREQSLQDFEVVVVDNSPDHNTAGAVEAAWPQATVLRAPSNLGFTGGNNLAARHARGKYLILLNQDTVAHPEFLEQLVAAAEADESIGAAHAKVLILDRRDRVDSAGNRANYLFMPAGRAQAAPLDDVFGPPRDVQYLSGAAVLVPRALWENLGGLDDSFWMYHDDLDLSLRLKLRAYRVVCVPDSVVYHAHDENPSKLKLEWLERNRLLLMRKYYRRRTVVKLLPILLVSEAGILLLAAKGGWLKEKLRGYRMLFRPDARALADGKRTRRETGYTDRQLLELMGPELSTGRIGGAAVQRIAGKLVAGYYRLARRMV